MARHGTGGAPAASAVTLGAAALVHGSWWWLLVDPHMAEGEKLKSWA